LESLRLLLNRAGRHELTTRLHCRAGGSWGQFAGQRALLVLANKFGINPVDWVKAIYRGSQYAMWNAGDILRAQRILELEKRGMSRDAAIREMVRHQPDYRIPLKVMGSPEISNFLNNARMSVMFTRYHYKVFGSLADMTKALLRPGASYTERVDAAGHVMALGILAFVLKPMFDSAIRWASGNPEAEGRPRGPLVPLYAAADVVRGKKDLGQALSGAMTMTPVAQLGVDVLHNRDVFGRQIVNPQSAAPVQVAQGLEHVLGTLIAPYAQFKGLITPGSSKGTWKQELRDQLLDIKEPTAMQSAGQRYGEFVARREEAKRAVRPRGPIEYLGRRATAPLEARP
jgi:hypothetical protein